jgi:hypothetical protein
MLSLAEDRSPSGLGIQKKAKESFLPPAPLQAFFLPEILISHLNTRYLVFAMYLCRKFTCSPYGPMWADLNKEDIA